MFENLFSVIAPIKEIKADAWAAIIAAGAAIWTIYSNTKELKASRFISGFERLEKMEEKFESTQFLKIRSASSKYLLDPHKDESSPPPEMLELLNFFEQLAYFEYKDMIEAESIWHFMSGWMLPYLAAATGVLMQSRHAEPQGYCYVDGLLKKIISLEGKHTPNSNPKSITAKGTVERFLRKEAEL